MDLLNVFLLSIPFWIPAMIGFYLVANRHHELSLMAGLLTLKPILTTPIWYSILGTLPSPVYGLEPAHFYSILPGASLTVLIAVLFRRLPSGPDAGNARVLLTLDCARWLNSFLFSLPYDSARAALGCLFALIGLALPTVFAVVATTLSQSSRQEIS